MSERTRRRVPIVLIVEDEWMLRAVVCEHLREAGWMVYEAASGEEALVKIDTLAIDVVFTDIRLNGSLTGWDVGEACRRKFADFPVIYTTGLTVEPPRRVNGSLFFSKPYDPEQIRLACERITVDRRDRPLQ